MADDKVNQNAKIKMQNDKSKIKIIFLGTPEFGAIILEGLIKNNYKPCLVITAPDKPVGRKQILTPPPVKVSAQKYNILIAQPERIKNLELRIKNLKPDLMVSAAFGQILPKEILEIPKYGCLNVHPSLLSKHRGPSPVQTAILNGDKETGVTIFLIDEEMDHGKIVASIKHKIASDTYYQKLEKELAELGIKLLIETIPKWLKGKIKAEAQDESKATYTKILKKEDGKINWKKSAQEIERQIRAFYPWPGTFTFFKRDNATLRVKILEAEVLKEEDSRQLCIKCGKDYLTIKKLQPEGKKPMPAEDFKRGYYGYNPLF